MRVLMCVPAYAPAMDYGGPITKVRLLAAELADLEVQVEVLAANFGPGRTTIEAGRREVDGIAVTYLRRIASRGWLSIAPGAGHVIRQGGFDVVHCFGLRDGLVTSAAIAAGRAKLPVVLEPMGMAMPRVRSRVLKGAFDWTTRSLLRSPEATIATSHLEADELRRCGYDNVVVRYNPVEPGRQIGERPKVFDICYVGRLHRKKQLHVILELLVELPSARAVVAGPDEDGSGRELLFLAAALGVSDRLEVLGWLPPDRRDEVLSASRCFVLASLTENFGNAAAEALRLGVPVIVTDQCGVAELVNSSGAGVVTTSEPSNIVAGAVSLLGNPARLARAARAAGPALADLDPATIAAQQLAIYKSVAGHD